MMRHLTAESLLDQVENKAVSPIDPGQEEHLAICARCQAELKEFQELLGFLAEDARSEPPADLLNWGIQLFQPVFRPEGAKVSKIRRIAQLVFDSFEQPLPVGIRHVGSVPRQLLFRAGDIDVDLRIESGVDDRITLAGQVLSGTAPFFEDMPVRLESHGVTRYKTRTNPVGEFAFDEVPEDTYHLSMDLPEGQVTLFCVHRSAPVLA